MIDKYLNRMFLTELDSKIRKNIKMKKGYSFEMIEPNTIRINKEEHKCFYIVVHEEKYDNYLYTCIVPDYTKIVNAYEQHGILNGERIIEIINEYYGIDIKYVINGENKSDNVRESVTKQSKEITLGILDKYIDMIKKMKDYLELEGIMTNMIEELREKSFFSMIDGEHYLVIEMVKNIIDFDEEFKTFVLDDDRMSWITREFHDSHFDFDGFENGVKEAMRYVEENYEETEE